MSALKKKICQKLVSFIKVNNCLAIAWLLVAFFYYGIVKFCAKYKTTRLHDMKCMWECGKFYYNLICLYTFLTFAWIDKTFFLCMQNYLKRKLFI